MQRTDPFPDREDSANDTVRRPLGNGPAPARAPAAGRQPFADPFAGLGGLGAPAAPAPSGGSPYAEPAFAHQGFPQAPATQAPFAQPSLPQTGFGQTGFGQSGFGQAGFGQAAFPQAGFGRGSLNQGSLGQGALAQAPYGAAASGPLADLASVLAPQAGGRGRADVLSPAARRADEFVDNAFDAAALNPLVSVASPLLWLAARLNESAAPADVRLFRDRVVDEIRRFESAAMAKGVANRAVLVARYALCATVDDIILNTAWAGQAHWATGSLVSLLYGETWGGERFFELLGQLVHAPDENIDLLEMLAICLAIGFVGKYRVMDDGANALTRLRAELYRIIRRVRGSYERDLAPAWAGAVIPYRAPPSALRFWLPILAALVLLAGFYLVLRLSLASRIDIASQRIAALVPPTPVAVPKPDIPAKPARLTQVQRISAVLQREIADRRVEVVGSPTTVAVRLPATSFPSSAAALPASDAPLLERIAAALNREPGSILVTGHTDNTRPAPTSAIRTNLDLSRARATSVAAMLKPYLSAPDRVTTAGRGEDDPIGSNATPEGRAKNRRVDIQIPAEETLVGRGGSPAGQAPAAPSPAAVPPATAAKQP